MLKSVIVGKKVDGVVQATKVMVLSGDRIVLVDATTGQPPKKIVTKIIGKDLHIFTEDATEPSVILSDYTSFQDSVHISGIGAGGSYVDYPVAQNTAVEFDPNAVAPAAPAVAESSGISGTTILLGALAIGGIAAAAGGGGGGGGSSTPAATTVSGYLIDSAVKGVAYTTSSGLSGTTGADGSFSYKAGDTVTFKVGNATIGTFSTASINTDGKIYLQDLVGISRGTTDAKSINIAQFLQTLDSDNDPSNGITIDSTVASKIPTIDVQTATDAQLLAAIQTANPAITALVTETAATNHLTDVTSPTAAITLSDTTLNSGETATVTVTFSEAVKNFSNADVTVQNGTLSTLKSTDGGITWTATFTPTANLSDTTNVITIGTNYTDTAGNAGTAVTSGNYVVDTTVAPPSPPSVTITDDENSVGNIAGGTITYTFTFSESVTGFTADDVVVTHGTKGVFSGSGTTYTLVVTPESGYEGNMSVSVPAGSAIGVTSGGQNVAANYAQAVDMSAPSAPSFSLSSDSGVSATDNITNVATVNVSGIESGASWEYSLNGGTTWTSGGSGTTFALANNATYAINAIQVRQIDSAGNTGTAVMNADPIVIDKTKPTATVSMSDVALSAGETAIVTITFSEVVSGFSNADVTVANGTLSTLTTTDNITWTAVYTPTVNVEDSSNVITLANTYADTAGNAGTVANSANYSVDTKAPGVVITDNKASTTNGDIVYTFTFSEAVSGFDATDITVANGSKGTFLKVSDTVYTLAVTPTSGFEGDVTVDVASSVSVDAAGNGNTSATQSVQAVDTKAPTATISMSDVALKAGETSTVTITFSEAVKNFGNADITVQNGTLSTLTTTDSITWTATYTPSTDVESTTNAISLATTYTDMVGNSGTAATSANYTIDTKLPAVVITDDEAAITANSAGGSITYTFTFSEAVSGFTADDIVVTHGTKGTFSGSGSVYTLVVTPTPGFEGNVTVDVAALVANDTAGNQNTAAVTDIQAVDTASPTATVSMSDVALKAGDTSTVTITFSEAVLGFGNADVTVANGTLSTLTTTDNITWTATYTPSVNIESTVNVISLANSYTDMNYNSGTVATSSNYTVDTASPTATVSMSDVALSAGETATVTIIFSEVVSGFSNADVTVANGTLSTLTTTDNITWTAVYTPTVNVEDSSNVVSLANTYTDTAGNAGTVANSANYSVDTKAPGVVITDNKTSTTNGDIVYTFTFSEAVSGFDATDITVANGTKGTFLKVSDTVYTLAVTPTSGYEGDVTVDVASSVSVDAAGNGNTSATQSVQAVDTKAPTATISMSDVALKAGETSTVTITFSEAVKNFGNADVTVQNGTLSTLTTTDSITWTATYTPSTDVESTTNAISLATTYTDMVGNSGTVATSANYTIDTRGPILTITDNEPNITSNMDGSNADGTVDADGADILYTFTFDEAVKDFTVSDIIINGGLAKTFTKVSDTVYTLGVTPNTGYEGALTVSVDPNSYHDVAGNAGNTLTDTSSAQNVDMLAPVFSSIAYDYVNRSITLTMDQILESVNMTTPDNFVVEINTKVMNVLAVAMNGDQVTLFMSDDFDSEQSIRILYSDSVGDMSAAIQDLAGNDTTSFTNLKPDVTPPTVTDILFDSSALSIGESTKITIQFSEEVSDVVVSYQNGTLSNLSADANDASIWTATFTPTANIQDYSNTFTVVSFHDLNKLANTTTSSATYIVDTLAPSVTISDDESAQITNIAGGSITYTFTFNEAVYGFSASDIVVTNGTKGTFTGTDGDLVYTLVVTPNSGYEGNVTVDIAADVVTDMLGNGNTVAIQSVQQVDMLALSKPSFTLATDSGNDASDGITNVNGINVTVDTKADAWQYSLDGGNTWRTGNGTSFKLTADTLYAVDAIQVRQIDIAGNISNVATNDTAIIIDKTAPTFVSMSTNGATGTITITMDSQLDPAAVAAQNFIVEINGIAQTVTGATVSGTDVVLTLSGAFAAGAAIRVAYADTAGDDYPALQDLAGNTAVGFTQVVSDGNTPSATLSLSSSALKVGETATVTIVFSEAVTGFTLADLNAQNGTLSNLATTDNIIWTATYTPTAGVEDTTNIITLSATYTDLTLNTGTTAASSNYVVDTLAPSVTVSDNVSGTAKIGESVTYTFTFSEAVYGFSASDIVVTNGAKGTFTGVDGDSVYTLVVTPNSGYEGNVTVDVAAGKVTDLIGNGNDAAVQSVQAVDMKAPTLTITDDQSTSTVNIADGNITYTFTFSETVVGFTADDITVTNGTKGTFSGSGSTYTLVVTPYAGLEGDVTVSVLGSNQVDGGGNTGTTVSSTQAVDTSAPSAVAFTLQNDTGLDNTDNVTTDTTMLVSGVVAGGSWEYNINNGGWILGSGNSFDLSSNTTYAIGSIQVRQTDAAGNVSSVTTNSETYTIDTVGPKLTITDNEANITANMDGSNADGTTDADGADILYTFTFSEAVVDFTASDVTLTHGITKTFTKVSDTVYTLSVTPEAGYEGAMDISVATTDYHDLAGNGGNALSDTSSSQFVDMLAPTYVSSSANVGSDMITITFSETLDAVNFSDVANFIVEINGTLYNSSSTPSITDLVSGVSSSGNTVNLVLNTATHDIDFGDVIRIAYSDASGDSAAAVQDLAGNDASSFGYVTATVENSDTPPVLTSMVANSLGITLSFNESLNESNTLLPATTDFTVKVNGVANTVTGVVVAGSDVTLTLATAYANNDLIEVTYTDPTQNNDLKAVQDLVGNDALSFTYTTTADRISPTVNSIVLSDSVLTGSDTSLVTIEFSEAVKNFSLADLNADNGLLSNLITTDDITWTATYTPNTDIEYNSNVVTLANTYTDMVGNGGTVSTSANYTIDTKGPTLSNMVASDSADTIVMTFSENLDTSNLPGSADFVINVNGTGLSGVVSSITATGSTMTLNITAGQFGSGDTVKVTYTDSSAGNDLLAIQDLNGNDAASFTYINTAVI